MTRSDFAYRLVRLYPLAWRERYQEELLGLIDDTPLTPHVVADLVAGALRERVQSASRVDSASGHLYETVRDVAMTLVYALLICLAGWTLGSSLRWAGDRRSSTELPGLMSLLLITRVIFAFSGMARSSSRIARAGAMLTPYGAIRSGLTRPECLAWAAAIVTAIAMNQALHPAGMLGYFANAAGSVWLLRSASWPSLARKDRLRRWRRSAAKAVVS